MDEDIAYIGMRHAWGQEIQFGLHTRDRRHHLYVVGKTGSGKTTLLRNLIVQDIAAGRGVGVIDPHGDLACELLDYVPPRRIQDVIYFDPADYDFPIGINLLRPPPAHERHLVNSGLVSAFKNIWKDSWGPRMEWVLTATIAALLECQNVSLLSIPRTLADELYRRWVLKQVKDPVVRRVWEMELGKYDKRQWTEVVAPIQNKIGQLLIASPLRNILGQIRSRIDPASIMDRRRIFIANLSKGRLGEDKSNLLGSLLTTMFQLAAMRRANVSEHRREDFFLFVDEFQNFTSDSFIAILSEARKYRLCLTLSHQHLMQVREEIRHAVFGNVGSIISFRVGSDDAAFLSREFDDVYVPGQLTQLGKYQVLAKLLSQNEYAEPFFGTTLAPVGQYWGRRDTVIQQSRRKYSTKRDVVEDKIRRWLRA